LYLNILKAFILFLVSLLSTFELQAQSGANKETVSSISASNVDVLGLPPSTGPVEVDVSFELYNINEIDDDNETFEFTGVLVLTWLDERQAFDPQKEMVKEKIYQGDFQFNEVSPAWYPQVILRNKSGLFEQAGTLLRIKPDGTSTLTQSINAIAKVKLDLRRLPFDSQKLEAVFEILGFDSSEVLLKVKSKNDMFFNKDLKISEWKFKNISAKTLITNSPYSGKLGNASNLLLNFEVKRESLFMMRLVVFPLAIIVCLSWSVFWMDRSSLGDRINVSFIGILTAVAYQLLIAEKLPHISYVTLINSFVNISFLTMSLSVIMNIIVGEYDKKGFTEKGDKFDRRCRTIFPLTYFSLLLLSILIFFLIF